MVILIIYLIGFVISYSAYRYFARKSEGSNYKYSDVIIILIFSLFSWVAILGLLIVLLIDFISNLSTKPPKWL